MNQTAAQKEPALVEAPVGIICRVGDSAVTIAPGKSWTRTKKGWMAMGDMPENWMTIQFFGVSPIDCPEWIFLWQVADTCM